MSFLASCLYCLVFLVVMIACKADERREVGLCRSTCGGVALLLIFVFHDALDSAIFLLSSVEATRSALK